MADEPTEAEEVAGDVDARIELTGHYEDVMTIVGAEGLEYPELETVIEGMTAVLVAVERTGGGTKSRLAEELPSDLSPELAGEDVGEILAVLAHYDLVELEGNTWKPGPKLD